MTPARTNIAICAEHKKLSHSQLKQLGFMLDSNTIYSTVAKSQCQVCKSVSKSTLVLEGEVMEGGNGVRAKDVNTPPKVDRRKPTGREVPVDIQASIDAAKQKLVDGSNKYSLLIDIALTDERGRPVARHVQAYKAKRETASGTFQMLKKSLDEAGRSMEKKDGN